MYIDRIYAYFRKPAWLKWYSDLNDGRKHLISQAITELQKFFPPKMGGKRITYRKKRTIKRSKHSKRTIKRSKHSKTKKNRR